MFLGDFSPFIWVLVFGLAITHRGLSKRRGTSNLRERIARPARNVGIEKRLSLGAY